MAWGVVGAAHPPPRGGGGPRRGARRPRPGAPRGGGARLPARGASIPGALVFRYGRDEFLQRLSHPFWFQSFGAVMGMDWHSSGITTSVIGALKRGLGPLHNELGIHVCGGRGRHSRKTPDELAALGTRVGIDALAL